MSGRHCCEEVLEGSPRQAWGWKDRPWRLGRNISINHLKTSVLSIYFLFWESQECGVGQESSHIKSRRVT